MRRLIGLGMLTLVCLSIGCAAEQPLVRKENTGKVDVYIIATPGGRSSHTVVSIQSFPTVLEVTRRAAGVQTVMNANGEEWPVVIDGGVQNVAAGRVWTYELNNGYPNVAPNLKHLSDGDVLVWRLE